MELIRVIRPWQWIKNLFVFLPMFFAGRMADGECWAASIWVFFAMCLMASAVYCVNDIIDVDENRRHPVKSNRPIAKGSVTKTQAGVMAVVLSVLSFLTLYISFPLNRATELSAYVGGYLVLNMAYCMGLKRVAIVDVFCISIGFVLRVFIGGCACRIWVSPWLVCLTFLLSLFLALAKRRDDLILHLQDEKYVRESSVSYNLPFMDLTLGLIGAITMVCYILYTVQPEVEYRLNSRHIYLTSIFVLAGILRYLQLAIVKNDSGSPTSILLKDRFIQGCIMMWILSYIVIIYLS